MNYQAVQTVCPYCAVGCNLILEVIDGEIVGTRPVIDGPNNAGSLCIKGWAVHEFIQHSDRLDTPLIRKDGELVATDWKTALDHAGKELVRIRDTYGPDSVVFAGSARCTNEENYIFQKFVRAGFGRNHVDHCARL